jgi:hypothetical protein
MLPVFPGDPAIVVTTQLVRPAKTLGISWRIVAFP